MAVLYGKMRVANIGFPSLDENSEAKRSDKCLKLIFIKFNAGRCSLLSSDLSPADKLAGGVATSVFLVQRMLRLYFLY